MEFVETLLTRSFYKMHQSSFDIVSKFVKEYVKLDDVVLEVGSYDVNGSHRCLFENNTYIGLDIEAGPNVDVVASDPYDWVMIPESSVDIVVCASVLEHVEFPWLTMEEIERVLKPNGHFCLVVPAVWPEHKHPIDCWRIYPDGMKSLCKWVGLSVLDTMYKIAQHDGPQQDLFDCYCIGYKP